jgi:molybdopterin-guanine dinucleotide biosynthesis protein A
MIVAMQATLLVLAGGQGSRMGRSKAWLEVGDTTLVRWVARRLAPSFTEVIVSFAEPEQLEELIPYRVVFDRAGAAGPLAGIEAGLAAARHALVFAIACDMPFVTQEIAEMALSAARGSDAAVPRIGGRPEPVSAAYSKSALPVISAALDAGDFKAAGVLGAMEVTWLEGLDAGLFRSLNTPEDYRDFHSALRHSDN